MIRTFTSFLRLAAAFIFFAPLSFAQQQPGMTAGNFNYTSFSGERVAYKDEALLFNPGNENDPELGHLFAEAPCEDCYEVISKRTETSKYFLKRGTNGTYLYQQSSTDAMHIRDTQGNFRTVITQLRPDPVQPGLYTAHQQPIPVGIDVTNGYTYIGGEGYRFYFHRGLELIFEDAGGNETSLGAASWSAYTAGDDGVYITNAWPGIDIELKAGRGHIKSNYIIRNPLPQYASGRLKIRDNWKTDENISVNQPKQGEFHEGIEISDRSGNVLFVVSPAVSYDANSRETDVMGNLSYEFDGDQVDIIIPEEWFNRDAAAFPVTIDPLFQGTNAMAITGSGYNFTCFTGGCAYNLAVPVPAGITVTDIRWTFNYTASGFLCYRSDGAVDFTLGSCRSPNAAGFYWFCNVASAGACNGNNISILSDVQTCVPAPQCAGYNMNFTMRFYRCWSAGGGCTNNCIAAASPLTMVVEGRTVEMTGGATTLPAVTICQGQSTTLSATGTFGVAPYSYTWNPGGLTGSPSVSPASTTTYTVIVTDQCGNTTTATKTVNVTPGSNPGFTVSPNPVCQGQPVTITGSGSSAAASYDWTVPGSTTPTVNNTQTFNATYNTAGTYAITLNFASGTCVFPSSQNITVTAPVAPTANITVSPSGALCPGQSVTFTATSTNGGTTPSYQWQVNGGNVGTNQNTFSSSTLQNGDVVTVIVTSNAPCVNPATATSNAITMQVVASLVPSVTIAANPAGAICTGTNVTFTATPANGGTTPSYQWQVNGSNVGTNQNTFSSSTLQNGDVVTVILTSSDPCANPTTATSNAITMQVNPPLIPSVIIAANPAGTICAGTNITFTATPTNGGTTPSYQWQVNGSNVGTNQNTFSSSTLQNGDVVTVILTSNAPCASPATGTSNSITMLVNPVVAPTVSITANPAGTICAGTNITFTATPANGGTTPSYQWQVNGSNVGTNQNTFSSSTLQNGDVVTVILTSSDPCANPVAATSNSITIQVNPALVPTASITAAPTGAICAGTSVTFTATITNGGNTPSYQWQVNGANVGTNQNTFTSTTLQNGDVVTVILTSNALCASPVTATSNGITMQVNPVVTPTVSITANPSGQICPGANVTFTATPVNGGTTPAYDWQVNGVSTGTNQNTFSSATLQDGDVVTVVLTSNAACLTTATAVSNAVTIDYFPPVTLTVSPDAAICEDAKITLTAFPASGNPASYTVTWQPSAGTGTSITVGPAATTTYTATVTDQCGTTASATVQVTVHPKPVASFTFAPTIPDLTNQPTTFTDGSSNAAGWQWNFGNGNTSTIQNPDFEFTEAGIYTVQLVVTSPENCTDTALAQIVIEDIFSLFIPSAFSPNMDPVNPVWRPYGIGLRNYALGVYNRWGQKIFESDKIDNGWDGILRDGSPAPQGVYDYRIEVEFVNNKSETFIGKLTLIR